MCHLLILFFLVFQQHSFAQTSCEDLFVSNEKAKRLTKPLTYDDIIRGISALREDQYPLNGASMQAGRAPNAKLSFVLGWEYSPARLYKAAVQGHKQKWDWWLREVGLDPALVKVKPSGRPKKLQLSEQQIIQIILHLHSKGVSVFAIDIQHKDDSEEFQRLTKDVVGYEVSPRALYKYATVHFKKKWSEWLELAVLEAHKPFVPENKIDLPEELILKLIKLMSFHSIPLNTNSISSNKNVYNFIEEEAGVSLSPSQIYRKAVGYYGRPWREWLQRADLDVNAILLHPDLMRSLTQEEIIRGIQYLREREGHPLNQNSIIYDRLDEKLNLRLSNYLGVKATPARIYSAAVNTFKLPWDEWLRKAGYDSRLIKITRTTLTADEIIKGIKILHELEYPLFHAFMRRNTGAREISQKLSEALGYRYLTPSHIIIDAVVKHRRPWDWWLQQAGLNPALIRRQHPRLTEEQIIVGIHKLHELGMPLNVSNISYHRHNEDVNKVLFDLFGVPTTPARIFNQAVYLFDRPWDSWLAFAGLNPNEIRKSGSAHAENLSPELLMEFSANYDALTSGGWGFEWNSALAMPEKVAVVTRTAEDFILESEYVDRVSNLKQDLLRQEQELLDKILDYFSMYNEFSVPDIAVYAGVSADEVLRLIDKLQNPSELQDLFGEEN